MPLLDDSLRMRLPPLHAQEAEEEPFVHARFYLPGTELAWYPIEGQAQGDDYLFFGFVAGPSADFRTFCLSELLSKRNRLDQSVVRDESFMPGKLTDVVPAPDS